MFDEEELPRPSGTPAPRNLEGLSVDELESYIHFLQEEINRSREEIDRKQASLNAADSIFK